MEKHSAPHEPRTRRQVTRTELILGVIVLFLLTKLYAPTWWRDEITPSTAQDDTELFTCHAPPLKLLNEHKIDHDIFKADIQWTESMLKGIVAGTNGYGVPADSVSVSIFLPNGDPIYETGFGRLRANESESIENSVDGDSMYRIASVTKTFTTAMSMLQKQRDVLSLDWDVSRILLDFSPAYMEYLESGREITVRQLLSHTSGLPRDFVNSSSIDWPWPILPGDNITVPPSVPTRAEMMAMMRDTPPVMLSYMTPVYSNLGFNVAGWVNQEIAGVPYEKLLAQDIFEPLGMNLSSFKVSPSNIDHIVVPGWPVSGWADLDMKDDNPCGGMYSSASDLRRFGQELLGPHNRVLTKQSVREWLRPVHVFDDGLLSVGLSWEIFNVPIRQRRMQLFAKGGTLPSYHTMFGIDPEHEFGIALLVSGEPSNTTAMGIRIAKRFAETLHRERQRILTREYAGTYVGKDKDIAELQVIDGELALSRGVFGGVDLFETYNLGAGDGGVVKLWPTHEPGIFRLALGRPPNQPFLGCMHKFASIDLAYITPRYAVDLLFLEGGKMASPGANKIANATSLTRI